MRQVNMTSLGDDARETLTIAGLEGQGTISGTTLTSACSTNLDSVVSKCESVLANDGGLEQSAHTPMEIGAVMSTCAFCGKAGHGKARVSIP